MRGGVLLNATHHRDDRGMQNNSFTSALGTLTDQLAAGTVLDSSHLLRAQELCLELFQRLGAQAATTTDPRMTLANAIFAEALSRHATRANITAASAVETTAAHGLHLKEFDDLLAGVTDFSAEPVFAPGRTVYQDSAQALASLLDLNYFEVSRRVEDAHLIHARRDMTGAPCAPRFTELAQQFTTPTDHRLPADEQSWNLSNLQLRPDPREVLKTARALNRFEPADTTFEGVPTFATAVASDGQLLETHAVAHLSQSHARTRQKRLNELIRDYKEAHGETKTPKLGLFRGKVVNGVHEFIVRVRALDAEVWESLITQADNKRTKAGAAARAAAQTTDAPAHDVEDGTATEHSSNRQESTDEEIHVQEPDELWSNDQPIPEWARPQDPDQEDPAQETAQPGESTIDLADRLADPPVVVGDCSVPERRLNALNAILRNVDPESGGKRVTPEIVVHANYEDLRDLASLTGITAHGVKISAAELRTMLCEAKILSPIYNADGLIMDIGRDTRLFPRWMKLAARDRDGGCLVPGCTVEPELLEFHHFKPWAQGGRTRLQDCCPLCTQHHVMVHSGYIKLVKIKGLIHVILPKHVDPDQIPQRNSYFART